MVEHYDTIVIGSGPGAMSTGPALAAKQKVLMIEQDAWGGTCPNRGCDPKKVLYGVVATYRQAQRFAKQGIDSLGALNWTDLHAFEGQYRQDISKNMQAGMKASGITTITGTASFVDAHTIAVNGDQYSADNIVLATGAAPTQLPIPGNQLMMTSDDFFDLDEMPASIAFIGAGYITAELATVAAAAGAKVHIIQVDDHFMTTMPQADAKDLAKTMTAQGVEFHWNTTVQSVTATDDGVLLHLDHGDALPVGAVITAIGRHPALDRLNLEAAGVTADRHGLVVDDHMRTNVAHIYALGDVVSQRRPKLTPVAQFEGEYVAAAILGDAAAISYPPIPTVAYTFPQIAQVGLNPDQADPEQYTITRMPVGAWYNYWHMNDQDAAVTTVVAKATGVLVGASILAANAEELINQFANLIKAEATHKEVTQIIAAYPTYSSDLPYYF